MSPLTFEMEIFNGEVQKVFDDLVSKDFLFQTPAIKSTMAIGEYVEVSVLNSTTGRTLIFVYTPAISMRPESISIFLQNDNGDSYSLSEFLSHKKIDPEVRKSITLANYSGSLALRLEDCLKASKEIILQYLKKSLFGKEWEPVPVHWGDLR